MPIKVSTTTAAMRSGEAAAAASGGAPSVVAPSPMVPTPARATAAHSPAANRSRSQKCCSRARLTSPTLDTGCTRDTWKAHRSNLTNHVTGIQEVRFWFGRLDQRPAESVLDLSSYRNLPGVRFQLHFWGRSL